MPQQKNPRRPGLRGSLLLWRGASPPLRMHAGSEAVFALCLLAREFARTADRFGFLAGLLLRGFLEMLLELHFTKHTFTLEFLLQRTKGLIDIVVTNGYLHVVFTTFPS